MTRERAKELLPVITAYADGKTLQMVTSDGWEDMRSCDPRFDRAPSCYRIKPEHRLRPWRPDEVPVGGLVRSQSGNRFVIIASTKECVSYGEYKATHEGLLGSMEHSTDGGKTWKPCGVEESP